MTRLDLSEPRWQIVADERNPQGHAPRRPFASVERRVHRRGNAQRRAGHRRRRHHAARHPPALAKARAVFRGSTRGTWGFLLNDADTVLATPGFNRELITRQMPLLYVETQPTPDGPWTSDLAFNDAWIERSSSQSAWIEVSVGEQVRLEKNGVRRRAAVHGVGFDGLRAFDGRDAAAGRHAPLGCWWVPTSCIRRIGNRPCSGSNRK